MFQFRDSLQWVMLAYLATGFALWYWKPQIMFNEEGKMKPFGTGSGSTVFSYPIVLIWFAMLFFFTYELIEGRKTQGLY